MSDENYERAFKWVKFELILYRVLAHYDSKEEIILASDYGLSTMISHGYKDNTGNPIAFVLIKIPTFELKRAIIDREAMAIVFGFKNFYKYTPQ